APAAGALIAARAGQGAGAALLTPAALSIITTGYAGAQRATALGIWGAIGGGGAAPRGGAGGGGGGGAGRGGGRGVGVVAGLAVGVPGERARGRRGRPAEPAPGAAA